MNGTVLIWYLFTYIKKEKSSEYTIHLNMYNKKVKIDKSKKSKDKNNYIQVDIFVYSFIFFVYCLKILFFVMVYIAG